MSIEYLPVGIACNLSCDYCYQDPMRDAGNISVPRNWEKARAQLEKENYSFTVFGGEALLAPIEHLEEVFKFGFERFGHNSVQTNGTLITDAHIELFQRYKVGVGISIDGPGELNDARWFGSLEQTREATARIHTAILKLCKTGIIPSIIVTLQKTNADTLDKLFDLCRWFDGLDGLGIRNINLHILETEKGRENLALTDEQNIKAFRVLYEYSLKSKIMFQPFRDIQRLLLQEELNSVSCIWNACDPLTTDAVRGVGPDGTQSNCGRTNKDGVNWVKADSSGSERYIALYRTPQECGGCRDCRYFAFCKGQCPGTAIDNDWRNRTVHCAVWFSLFEMVEETILLSRRLPISRDTAAREALEARLLGKWRIPHSNHGDTPHGDSHGDSDKGVDVTWL